jgi:Tol biopolymer transport system component
VALPPAGPLALPLPAPLYFIDDATGQIARLERDGATVTQITDEALPVLDFDISPSDGTLAFVTDNQLVAVDAAGANRRTLFSAPPVDPAADGAVNQTVMAPRFAPDGAELAFGFGGVQLLAMGELAVPEMLLASSDFPDFSSDEPPPVEAIRFFWPASWSPDGTRLLISFGYYPEGGGLLIYDLVGNRRIELTAAGAQTPLIGETAWSANGSRLFIASEYFVYGAPGLAQVESASGETTLLAGADADLSLFARAPLLEESGNLRLLAARTAPDLPPERFQPVRYDASAGTLTQLSDWTLTPRGAVLWQDDGSALVATVATAEGEALVWLALEGDAVVLPVRGTALHWGPPGDGQAIIARRAVQEAFLRTLPTNAAGESLYGGVAALPLPATSSPAGEWLAFTTGMRDFTADLSHQVAVFRQTDDVWQEVVRVALDDAAGWPDHVDDSAFTLLTEPDKSTWLLLSAGVGAHSGTCSVLRYNGRILTVDSNSGNSSPVACGVTDINDDGFDEVLLDRTDYYVFCYACAIREVALDLLTYRYGGMDLVTFDDSLPAGVPAEQQEFTAALAALVAAGLWKEAGELAANAGERLAGAADGLDGLDDTVAWNIRHTLVNAGRRRLEFESRLDLFPLAPSLFYGDYDAAVDLLRSYAAGDLFATPSALIAGTVADGWADSFGQRMVQMADRVIAYDDRRANAFFIRALGAYLADPAAAAAGSAPVREDLARAVALAPDEALFAEALAWLGGGEADVTAEDSAAEVVAAPVENSAGTLYFSAAAGGGRDAVFALPTGGVDAGQTSAELVAFSSMPAAQPGGGYLLVHSTRSDMLGIAAWDGAAPQHFAVTSNLEDTTPRWNPGGNALVFGSTRYGDGRSRIYRAGFDANATATDLGFGADPDWGPGDTIVFKGCGADGNGCGLWLMDAAGGNRRALTANPGDSRPRFTPDGATVVFMSDQRDGNWDVYAVAVAGGAVTRITQNPANDGLPAVSPDGQRVAFYSDRGGVWGIWQVAMAGGAAAALVADLGPLPEWRAHGADWRR